MPLITAETAREMAVKGNAALRRIRESRRDLPERVADLAAQVAALANKPPDVADLRLARVRKQLDLLDKRILAMLEDRKTPEGKPLEPFDGQQLNWLCTAQERVAEQERILSGKPNPGTLRPRAPREPRERPGRVMPLGPVTPACGASTPTGCGVSLVSKPPAATPIPRPAPTVGPVPIEVALRHRPAPVPTPPPPAPAQQQPVPIEVALRHRPAPLPTPAAPRPPSQKPG